jgi:hypothetical protein
MNNLHLTRHAMVRMSQRGIGRHDIELIASIGTEVEGSYLVRSKDVQTFVRKRKMECERARRLEGTWVVVEDGCVLTTYRPRKDKERRLLRSSDERSLSVR